MSDAAAFNPFAAAQQQFDRIAELMGLTSATRELLRNPMNESRFALPVRLDDGSVQVFRGFRVRHNDARGPSWGGVRFHPMETIDTVRALAMWMCWKTALVDIPLGGGMGGVVCDPHALSQAEQERICRSWVRRVFRDLGANRDIPGPDIMTSAQHMTWMLDEYEAIRGGHEPGAITGKTIASGGSRGRTQATGYGLVYILREALKELRLDASSTTASVQGFGMVAQHAIELYHRIGGRVICVACWDHELAVATAFRKPDGVDLDELRGITNALGSIDRRRAIELGYEPIDGDGWLEQDVDILIPAAIENQIDLDGAARIGDRVRVIVEGANGPTSPEAEMAILERGVLLIPDLLANAGGVICSYFEQVQSNANYYWRLDEVLSKLDHQLTGAFIAISELARRQDLSLRDAALAVAIDRVAGMCRERGWV